MSSRVAAVWHFQHAPASAERWHAAVLRIGLKGLRAMGRFVRAFLEVEPIFIWRF